LTTDWAADPRIEAGNGNPWWIAKEVCDVLGLANVTITLSGLDDDGKQQLSTNIINPKVGGKGRVQSHLGANQTRLIDPIQKS
jgi:prophage antirepressor-like protein